jgi:ribonuclease-3
MEVTPSRLDELAELGRRLGYTFVSPPLLNKALTHRSFANEADDPDVLDNERFEFLGDSILDLIVADYIVAHEKKFREGRLSRIRAQVVNEQALAEVARDLALGEFLLLGKGEEASGGRDKTSLLANAMEAVIAAVYVDADFPTVTAVFLPVFRHRIDAAASGMVDTDFKGRLQRALKGGATVSYRLVDEAGPDHEKVFTVDIIIDDITCGQGTGRTKKEAEQRAAQLAVERWESEQGVTPDEADENGDRIDP